MPEPSKKRRKFDVPTSSNAVTDDRQEQVTADEAEPRGTLSPEAAESYVDQPAAAPEIADDAPAAVAAPDTVPAGPVSAAPTTLHEVTPETSPSVTQDDDQLRRHLATLAGLHEATVEQFSIVSGIGRENAPFAKACLDRYVAAGLVSARWASAANRFSLTPAGRQQLQ